MEQTNSLPNPPVPPQMPTNPPVNSSFLNKPILAILLIVFFIILSSLVTYLLVKSQTSSQAPITSPASLVQATPTPDPTADWKTYESTRFKFSFKYPSELVLDSQYENIYPDRGGINLSSPKEYQAIMSEQGRGGGPFISLWVHTNPQNLATLEWMKKDTAHSNFSGQEYSTIDIGGEKGYIYQWSGMGTGLEAVVSKNGYIYTISDLGYDDYLKQILSTFKFLD